MNKEGRLSQSRKNHDWKWIVSLAILSLCLGGCPAALLLVPPLIEFGANLMSTANENYDSAYTNDVKGLLVALQQQRSAAYASNNPNIQGQGAPYHQNQGYPVSEYPDTPYPTNDPYANQPYDPNAAYQQEAFSDPTYPTNPELNPQDTRDPYASHSAYPGSNPNNPNDQYNPSMDDGSGGSDPYFAQTSESQSHDQQAGYGTNPIGYVPIGVGCLTR